ncbi:MAG: hypothetical protein HC882_05490 [Acidobacteria bacterium]|nr:hypothetical protein [Acidobacteriota bacterium]
MATRRSPRGSTRSPAASARAPGAARIDALARRPGDWLFSLESATRSGGTLYDPRDVIRYDGAAYSLFLGGAAQGIPSTANVDAIAIRGAGGTLLLSVDAPATIGGIDVEAADVLRYSGGVFTLLFDASAHSVPIPRGVNVSGLDETEGGLLVSFDVPITLGGFTYLPGDVVRVLDQGFSLARRGTANGWAIRHEIAGFSLPSDPGDVDDLRVVKGAGGVLRFEWDASCSLWAADYAVYGGRLGDFASHRPIVCTDAGGDRRENYTPPSLQSEYFLIVPLSAANEGSYGQDSAGAERPRGVATCRAAQGLPVCDAEAEEAP